MKLTHKRPPCAPPQPLPRAVSAAAKCRRARYRDPAPPPPSSTRAASDSPSRAMLSRYLPRSHPPRPPPPSAAVPLPAVPQPPVVCSFPRLSNLSLRPPAAAPATPATSAAAARTGRHATSAGDGATAAVRGGFSGGRVGLGERSTWERPAASRAATVEAARGGMESAEAAAAAATRRVPRRGDCVKAISRRLHAGICVCVCASVCVCACVRACGCLFA